MPRRKGVSVHRNNGLLKRCACGRESWSECTHPWYFNFCYRKIDYRFNLNKQVGREHLSREEASREAGKLRSEIRSRKLFRRRHLSLKPTPTKITITYLMQSGLQLKIGRTTDLYMRAKSLQAGMPLPLYVRTILFGDFELQAKRLFRPFRLHDEFFSYEPQILQWFKNMTVNQGRTLETLTLDVGRACVAGMPDANLRRWLRREIRK